MSVIHCKEIGDGRAREENASSGEITYTRTWQLITNNPQDDGVVIAGYIDIPEKFDPHPNDSLALVKSITPEQGENHYEWKVKVEYSTFVEEDDADPLTRSAKYRWTMQPFTRPAIKDVFTDAISNSAFDAYDPPAMMDDVNLVLTYTRNEATFDAVAMLGYANTLNSDDFLGFAAEQAKIKTIDGESAEEPGYPPYFVVTYVIEFRDSWLLVLLDQGYRSYDAGDHTQITDGSGRAITQPALLDGAGQPLDIENDPPVFTGWEIYDLSTFADLDIVL